MNRPGDGEKRPPVSGAGAHIWPAKPNVETNGETEDARNVGQLGTWGSGYGVNKQRGNRCGEVISFPKPNKGYFPAQRHRQTY